MKQLFPQFGEMDEHIKKQLKASMGQRFTQGFGMPVVDEDGNIIDGKHRLEIAEELGLDIPIHVAEGWTDEEKWEYAFNQNYLRRHAEPSTRREVEREALKRNPSRSNREIASALGVSHNTIAARRREMESAGQIDQQTPQLNQYARGERLPFEPDEEEMELGGTPVSVSNHRGETSFRLMFFYPAPVEETRARGPLTYTRESRERTWSIDPSNSVRKIPLNAGAPKTDEDLVAIADEIRERLLTALRGHPPVTMDKELMAWR